MSTKIVKLPDDEKYYWLDSGIPITEENVRRYGVAVKLPTSADQETNQERLAAAEHELQWLKVRVAALEAERRQ